MTFGPRTWMSPSTPSGTAAPASSRISTSTVGSGRPTAVGNASSSSPLFRVASAVHSVRPYPTPIVVESWGIAAFASRMSAGEKVAPPPPPLRIDDRSYRPNSGWEITRWSMVGVNDQCVTRSASMRRMITTGSNRPIVQTLFTPPTRNAIAAVWRPETWKSGLDTSCTLGPASGAGGSNIMLRRPWKKVMPSNAPTLRCVWIAPFGRPVVPLV
jgi:hypothetical protein